MPSFSLPSFGWWSFGKSSVNADDNLYCESNCICSFGAFKATLIWLTKRAQCKLCSLFSALALFRNRWTWRYFAYNNYSWSMAVGLVCNLYVVRVTTCTYFVHLQLETSKLPRKILKVVKYCQGVIALLVLLLFPMKCKRFIVGSHNFCFWENRVSTQGKTADVTSCIRVSLSRPWQYFTRWWCCVE